MEETAHLLGKMAGYIIFFLPLIFGIIIFPLSGQWEYATFSLIIFIVFVFIDLIHFAIKHS